MLRFGPVQRGLDDGWSPGNQSENFAPATSLCHPGSCTCLDCTWSASLSPAMKTHPVSAGRACPCCKTSEFVVPKMLLIGAESPDPERAGYQRSSQLAVDEIEPPYVASAPLQQFIEGCYCNRCGRGFVPDHAIKPSILRARKQ